MFSAFLGDQKLADKDLDVDLAKRSNARNANSGGCKRDMDTLIEAFLYKASGTNSKMHIRPVDRYQ